MLQCMHVTYKGTSSSPFSYIALQMGPHMKLVPANERCNT